MTINSSGAVQHRNLPEQSLSRFLSGVKPSDHGVGIDFSTVVVDCVARNCDRSNSIPS
jgi:hypothetical protein